MVKIENIKDEDIVFKEELTGLDYLLSLDNKKRVIMVEELRICSVALKNPRLTYEELISLPIGDFIRVFMKYTEKYTKKVQPIVRTPVPTGQTVYNFPQIPPMSKISQEANKEEE